MAKRRRDEYIAKAIRWLNSAKGKREIEAMRREIDRVIAELNGVRRIDEASLRRRVTI
jgi:hypothetical protein